MSCPPWWRENLIFRMNNNPPPPAGQRPSIRLRGIQASAGLACGPAWVIHARSDELPKRTIAPEEVEAEIARFHKALQTTRQQIVALVEEVSKGIGPGEAGVFDAHLMAIDDTYLISRVEVLIREQVVCAEIAVNRVANECSAKFAAMQDVYLRERSVDILDIGRRILRNLMGVSDNIPIKFDCPHIIIADDLTPSQTVGLPRGQVLGLATDHGSTTSHTVIIARALGIPAVVGLKNLSAEVRLGDQVLLDGDKGTVIVHPSSEELEACQHQSQSRLQWAKELPKLRDLRSETLDGRGVTLLVNADHTTDTKELVDGWAEGIGLYRTESLWMQRGQEPSEQEQAEIYIHTVRALKGRQVVFRVLDLGGDKQCKAIKVPPESNPFLGLRSIRYLLKEQGVFRRQLRAILRASAFGDVQMMYPMVCDVEELKESNAILAQCKAELAAEDIAFNPKMPVGVMIEIPSAALMAHVLARHADFFCLGTNDLIQYTLAVDRTNENVANLYQPTHPAVLALIRNTVKAARRHKRWVSVCGEMAGDPVLAVLLMGMGVDMLGMSHAAIPAVKHVIRKTAFADAQKLARATTRAVNAADALRLCRNLVRQTTPEMVTGND